MPVTTYPTSENQDWYVPIGKLQIGNDTLVQNALQAIQESLENLAGIRGDGRTSLVTVGDLLDEQYLDSLTQIDSTSVTTYVAQPGDYVWGNSPPPPTNLHRVTYDNDGLTAPWFHHLEWTNPSVLDNVYYIEVWASTINDPNSAERVAIVTPPKSDIMIYGVMFSVDYYYWVRSVSYGFKYSTWEPNPDTVGGYLVYGQDSVGETIDGIIRALAGENPPAWDSSVTYSVGDTVAVTDGESLRKYRCIAESTDDEPPNTTYWERFGILMEGEVDGTSVVGIDGNLVVDGTILARHIVADAIESAHIKAGEIVVSHIGDTSAILNANQIWGEVANRPIVPDDGSLVGYWPFEEGSGTETINATGDSDNNGTLYNTPTWSYGVSGGGLNFNAGNSEYVECGNDSSLSFTNNGTFSISVWVEPDDITASWRRGIAKREVYNTSGWRFGFNSTGYPMFWTDQSGGTLSVTSDTALTQDAWNHIVVTYDNQQCYIYLNGEQVGSGTGTYVAAAATLRIGDATSEYFDGGLDEFRMYSRALTATEVDALYRNPSGNESAYRSWESVVGTNKPEDGADVTAGLINGNAAPSGAGLYLGADYMGYFDSSNWKTYIDSSGNFYLGGASGPLQWAAGTSTLTIGSGAKVGSENVTAGYVAGWAHSSDYTKIDGGDIYANTVTASAIAANTITADQIAATTITAAEIASGTITATQLKGTDFGTLTISSGKVKINTTDALEIAASGNMKVVAGADIQLVGDNSNPGLLNFTGSGTNIQVGLNAAGSTFSLNPTTDGDCTIYFGTDSMRFSYIYLWGETRGQIGAKNDSYGYAVTSAMSDSTSVRAGFNLHDNSDLYFLTYTNQYTTEPTLMPNTHGDQDVGRASYYWGDGHFNDINTIADYYHLDEYDDLAELHKIKGSGNRCDYNGLEIIDDDTLPDFLISKARRTGKPQKDKGINVEKKGENLIDPDGKPFLSLSAVISHLWGCVRQLDNKHEDSVQTVAKRLTELEEKINGKKN